MLRNYGPAVGGRVPRLAGEGEIHLCFIPCLELDQLSDIYQLPTRLKENQEFINGPRGPTVILVMHQRLDAKNVPFAKATFLPYGEDTFLHGCKNLFQHPSISSTLYRISTATFSNRFVDWGAESPLGPSIGMSSTIKKE